jgi:hypothetical protein
MAKQALVMKAPANAAPVKEEVIPGNVDYVRRELQDMIPQYNVVRDCVAGEITVKAKGTTYLPMPQPTDLSPGNVARYSDYLLRAVFYNVTKRTLAGLSGQVFLRDPVIDVPTQLDPVIKDMNGEGVPAEQFANALEDMVLQYGRAGLLTDYPQVEGATSQAQILSGEVRPTIILYSPYDVINWRTISRGGKKVLSLVVIKELYQSNDDEFEIEEDTQYRVLRLVDGIYTVTVYRKSAGAQGYSPYEAPRTPLDSSGKPLTEIPFKFVGAKNNDVIVDPSPLYDLAAINLAHYRNSADYEESV